MVKYVRDVAAAVPRDGPLGNAELHYGSRMSAAETAISIVSTSTTRGIKPDHVGHVAKDLKRKEGRRARSEVRVKCKQHTAEQHSGEAP